MSWLDSRRGTGGVQCRHTLQTFVTEEFTTAVRVLTGCYRQTRFPGSPRAGGNRQHQLSKWTIKLKSKSSPSALLDLFSVVKGQKGQKGPTGQVRKLSK